MMSVDLSTFKNSEYNPGNPLKRGVWYFVNRFILINKYNPSSGLKKFFLRLFGAKLGKGIVIKPGVNIKYPWFLEVGDNCWIGEDVWIDNLGKTVLGANVCLSQGALLLCGNHNYKKKSFDLIVGEIHLADGVWIGAKAVVTGGVKCGSHSILTTGSVTSADLDDYTIYRGNPAVLVRKREMVN